MMGLHKLTAGDGYTYLTRQVAAADSTERGAASLAEYYSEKGESPGRWTGSGLAELNTIGAGEHVSEAHMKALFGDGLHPEADTMYAEKFAAALAAGTSTKNAERAASAAIKLGRAFKIDNGASDFRVACAKAFVEHNLAVGEKWNAPIEAEARATIRTRVAREMFEREYGRAPADERELSGWVAKSGRQNTKAVAGFDLTFTPVKSVSALWAVAPREISQEIEAAHDAAIAAALEYLEEHACFTRLGNGGVAQVDANGLIAAAFTHRDSRAGDPNLHTHVAISNKVSTTLPDGTKWLALDGAALYRNNVPASEVYNTALEAQLRERIGVEFTERPSEDRSKRPVREIVGLDARLAERWSSRSAAITVRTAELAREFQAEHHREPTAIESIRLAQRATLETRQAKHEPRSHADQRGGWRAEAIDVLGSPKALSKMVAAVTGKTRTRASVDIDDPRWIDYTAAEVVEVVSRARSRYQRHNIRAEAIRQVRTANPPADRITDLVEAITDRACSGDLAVTLGDELGDDVAADLAPEVMRRRDGRDVHTRHEATLFTTTDVLDAEARIVVLAGRKDGVAVADEHVEMALLEAAANGRELNAGQRSLVRAMATSGAKLQLALAPAGTGKTTAMTALTRSWQNAGGRVVGFAPTAAAAAVLRQDILTTTDTLAKFVDITQRLRDGKSVAVPEWYSSIGPDTLVIVDEAGMTGTLDLDEAVTALAERGATVRLIGDDQQLASVASGGVLRDIHDRVGALTLSQVVRFRDKATGAAEGAASLALRDGDDAAIGFYIDHSRLHVGSIATVTDDAYAAWASDRAAGKDALLLAPTRELVAELNTRARTDRLAATDTKVGREAVLADGLRASVGDIVRTRSNDRRNTLSKTDWVRNGDRWTVEEVGHDGSLVVRHLELGRTVNLTPDYVQSATELGYAGTVHSAQGSTADTCHVVATGDETRQLAYVALTRGRLNNHMYLATASDGDLHTAMTERGMLPPTAVDDFRAILRRDGAQVSAHSTLTAADDPHVHLAEYANAYDYSVATGAEVFLGPEKMAAIDAAAEAEVTGLTDEPAWPVLRGHLAIVGARGRDPVDALRVAVRSRELGTALDKAAVLDWRLDTSGGHSSGRGPLPWLPAIPTALLGDAAAGESAQWGAYLDARADTVAALTGRVAADVRSWTPATAQLWARPFFGTEEPDLDLLSALAVFRAAHGVDPDDRRPTGPMQLAAASIKAQRSLDRQAERALGESHSASTLWRPFVDELDTHIARDPYFPVLADRLSAAARAGIDVHTLVRDSLTASPLPDELPAAALWWRLSGELSAAALDTDDADSAALTPSWAPVLTELLGDTAAARVMSDPRWPSLVATVESADPNMWTPGQLLGTAYEFLHGGIDPVDHGVTFPAHELATALTWRAEMLVRENHLARTYIGPDVEPLSAEDEETLTPVDAEMGDSAADVLPPEFADPDNLPPAVNAPAHAESADATSPSIPDGSDADYLASLDGLDAPVEYDDAPPPEYDGDDSEPEALEPDGDEAGEVDPYAAMLEHATVLALPYPTVTADERVRLLTADLAAAMTEQRGLRAQIADGTSPTLLHMRTALTEMQEQADRQRPARIAMLDARQDWMDTEFEAEALWHRIDTVVRPAVAADVAAAGDDEDARALAARGLDWEIWRAGFADDAATAARTRAQEAAAEYERVTAADGGEVTTTDVITARGTAESIDLAVLAELQHEVDRLGGMVLRAEHAARRIAMTSTTAEPTTTTQPEASVQDDIVQEESTQQEVAQEDVAHAPDSPPELSTSDAALLEKMEQDPIRLVPDAELIAFVDRAGRSRTTPTVVADTEKLYARLDEQAAAIAAARELADELRRVRADHEAARSENSALTEQLSTAKRRDRKTLEPAVADARLREEHLARQVRNTQRAAQDAVGRVQAENSEWSAIVQRATDPGRRAVDLAAAAVFDTAITERGRRLRAVTLAGNRHAAEQRIRSAPATARRVEATAIDGVTDAVNRRSSDAKPADPDAQKNIARLLADAPGPGRPHSATQTQQPEQLPDAVVNERQYDNDHGL
ncbi:MobF family relaxase [Rhodococcus sp. IEGM 1374]|uniref:MobF family relaxase n=1 Tax=Rhodococcus sp. IEGM 1374 TaxID=3082221 RepID=UPI002953C50F|nr:MobF family relaxase [Rhodococcus sp. IEGM 1374]MDV7991591.1 MobF family relaxase [Rhodococcus sp. IEGM 1374]